MSEVYSDVGAWEAPEGKEGRKRKQPTKVEFCGYRCAPTPVLRCCVLTCPQRAAPLQVRVQMYGARARS